MAGTGNPVLRRGFGRNSLLTAPSFPTPGFPRSLTSNLGTNLADLVKAGAVGHDNTVPQPDRRPLDAFPESREVADRGRQPWRLCVRVRVLSTAGQTAREPKKQGAASFDATPYAT